MRKIGIFGGSFNPVHLGHYEIVRQILSLGRIDEVIILPAYQNPLKSARPQMSKELRLKMVTETFKDLQNAWVSSYELDKEGPSYTAESLEHFKALYPNDELYFIMGEDAFCLFAKWKEPRRILELAKLMVFKREGEDQKVDLDLSLVPPDRLEWLSLSIPKVSSTEIRELDNEKLAQSGLLPKSALQVYLGSTDNDENT